MNTPRDFDEGVASGAFLPYDGTSPLPPRHVAFTARGRHWTMTDEMEEAIIADLRRSRLYSGMSPALGYRKAVETLIAASETTP